MSPDESPRERNERLSWINPFRRKMYDFPGRLYTFDNKAADIEKAKAEMRKRARCVCEIGSGSGRHLIERARRDPGAGYFGVELRFKRAVRTIEKAIKSGVDNVYLLRTHAAVVPEVFEPNSLDALYVNFPDPWLKLKKRKKRMLGAGFLDTAFGLLKAQGFLSIKTDAADYYEEFREVCEGDTRFQILEASDNLYKSAYAEDAVTSEFEQLFLSQDLKIHYLKVGLRE